MMPIRFDRRRIRRCMSRKRAVLAPFAVEPIIGTPVA
jgi:hypothetical protein